MNSRAADVSPRARYSSASNFGDIEFRGHVTDLAAPLRRSPGYSGGWSTTAACAFLAPSPCFTFTLSDRRSDLVIAHADALREAFRNVRKERPFLLEAIVVLRARMAGE